MLNILLEYMSIYEGCQPLGCNVFTTKYKNKFKFKISKDINKQEFKYNSKDFKIIIIFLIILLI